MKKLLLLCTAASLGMSMFAETKFYTTEELGEVANISNNGKYAAIFDMENELGYLWDSENPEVFTLINGVESGKVQLYDVSDDGIAVGSFYQKGGRNIPCYVVDGQITALPLDPNTLNINEATAISPDGKYIAGYQIVRDATAENGGRNYPCLWTRNEAGEYELDLYNDVKIPDHQGFITKSMSADGKVIAGMLFCGAGSTIPALFVDRELKIWNSLEVRPVPFYYKGELQGYFNEPFIDGYIDGRAAGFFEGGFQGMDKWGNVYGLRTKAFDVSEDGETATLKRYACVYNYKTDEWLDFSQSEGMSMFATGLNAEYMFGAGDKVMIRKDDKATVTSASKEFGYTPDGSVAGISSVSEDGKVLGGMTQVMNPSNGEYQYFPFIVVLDEPIIDGGQGSGVEVLPVGGKLAIVLSAGRIDIAGAEGAVYDLDGKLVGTGSSINVAPGLYVVKVGEASQKVLVK